MNFSSLWVLARLRFFLLIRQKLGWLSFVLGVVFVLIAHWIAKVSYVSPEKIFWDFSLAVSFLFQLGLGIYLGTALYHEERGRRTLHLLLSSGVSRAEFIVGNVLGIWLCFQLIALGWFLLSCLVSFGAYDSTPALMAFQALWLVGVESLVVLFMATLFSLFLRPMLGILFSLILVLFLHSVSDLKRILVTYKLDGTTDALATNFFLEAAKFLPPLEWFDVKIMVGYEDQISWGLLGTMTGVGVAWALVLSTLTWLRFRQLDL